MSRSHQGIRLRFTPRHRSRPMRINRLRFIDPSLIRATKWPILPITTTMIMTIPIIGYVFLWVILFTITLIRPMMRLIMVTIRH